MVNAHELNYEDKPECNNEYGDECEDVDLDVDHDDDDEYRDHEYDDDNHHDHEDDDDHNSSWTLEMGPCIYTF